MAVLKFYRGLEAKYSESTATYTDGSFTVTPSTGGALKVTIGKPATAGTADNATTAAKVAQSLVVKLNGGTVEGTSQFTFNGSAAKTVNITAASVGAATASHTHSNYVPTTRTVNGKALSSNITLTAADVNADAKGSANTALASAKSYADGLWGLGRI